MFHHKNPFNKKYFSSIGLQFFFARNTIKILSHFKYEFLFAACILGKVFFLKKIYPTERLFVSSSSTTNSSQARHSVLDTESSNKNFSGYIIVEQSGPLVGTVSLSGAKNAVCRWLKLEHRCDQGPGESHRRRLQDLPRQVPRPGDQIADV